jgi:hypothetical protein
MGLLDSLSELASPAQDGGIHDEVSDDVDPQVAAPDIQQGQGQAANLPLRYRQCRKAEREKDAEDADSSGLDLDSHRSLGPGEAAA